MTHLYVYRAFYEKKSDWKDKRQNELLENAIRKVLREKCDRDSLHITLVSNQDDENYVMLWLDAGGSALVSPEKHQYWMADRLSYVSDALGRDIVLEAFTDAYMEPILISPDVEQEDEKEEEKVLP